MRKKHPNKEIEAAIQYAENRGWRFKVAGNSAHAWGRILCPLSTREGCILSIYSTPRDCDVHAKQIIRRVNSCLCITNEGEISYGENLSIHISSK